MNERFLRTEAQDDLAMIWLDVTRLLLSLERVQTPISLGAVTGIISSIVNSLDQQAVVSEYIDYSKQLVQAATNREFQAFRSDQVQKLIPNILGPSHSVIDYLRTGAANLPSALSYRPYVFSGLRPSQIRFWEALPQILDKLRPGQAGVIQQETGTGKTANMLALARMYPGKVFFIVPTISLGEQTCHKILEYYPDESVSYMFTSELQRKSQNRVPNDLSGHIVIFVADTFQDCVQSNRIIDKPGLILIDEEHSLRSTDFVTSVKSLSSEALTLGFTATPYNTSMVQKSPSDLPVTVGHTLQWLSVNRIPPYPVIYTGDPAAHIADKELCQVTWKALITDGSLKECQSDYTKDFIESEEDHNPQSELDWNQIIGSYIELYNSDEAVRNRQKTLVVCPNSRKLTEHAAKEFTLKTGKPSGLFVSGKSVVFSLDSRQQLVECVMSDDELLKSFRDGDFDQIFQIKRFIMGNDIPEIDCVAYLTDDTNSANFIQAVGRARRYTDAKKDCLVITLVRQTSEYFEGLNPLEILGILPDNLIREGLQKRQSGRADPGQVLTNTDLLLTKYIERFYQGFESAGQILKRLRSDSSVKKYSLYLSKEDIADFCIEIILRFNYAPEERDIILDPKSLTDDIVKYSDLLTLDDKKRLQLRFSPSITYIKLPAYIESIWKNNQILNSDQTFRAHNQTLGPDSILSQKVITDSISLLQKQSQVCPRLKKITGQEDRKNILEQARTNLIQALHLVHKDNRTHLLYSQARLNGIVNTALTDALDDYYESLSETLDKTRYSPPEQNPKIVATILALLDDSQTSPQLRSCFQAFIGKLKLDIQVDPQQIALLKIYLWTGLYSRLRSVGKTDQVSQSGTVIQKSLASILTQLSTQLKIKSNSKVVEANLQSIAQEFRAMLLGQTDRAFLHLAVILDSKYGIYFRNQCLYDFLGSFGQTWIYTNRLGAKIEEVHRMIDNHPITIDLRNHLLKSYADSVSEPNTYGIDVLLSLFDCQDSDLTNREVQSQLAHFESFAAYFLIKKYVLSQFRSGKFLIPDGLSVFIRRNFHANSIFARPELAIAHPEIHTHMIQVWTKASTTSPTLQAYTKLIDKRFREKSPPIPVGVNNQSAAIAYYHNLIESNPPIPEARLYSLPESSVFFDLISNYINTSQFPVCKQDLIRSCVEKAVIADKQITDYGSLELPELLDKRNSLFRKAILYYETSTLIELYLQSVIISQVANPGKVTKAEIKTLYAGAQSDLLKSVSYKYDNWNKLGRAAKRVTGMTGDVLDNKVQIVRTALKSRIYQLAENPESGFFDGIYSQTLNYTVYSRQLIQDEPYYAYLVDQELDEYLEQTYKTCKKNGNLENFGDLVRSQIQNAYEKLRASKTFSLSMLQDYLAKDPAIGHKLDPTFLAGIIQLKAKTVGQVSLANSQECSADKVFGRIYTAEIHIKTLNWLKAHIVTRSGQIYVTLQALETMTGAQSRMVKLYIQSKSASQITLEGIDYVPLPPSQEFFTEELQQLTSSEQGEFTVNQALLIVTGNLNIQDKCKNLAFVSTVLKNAYPNKSKYTRTEIDQIISRFPKKGN